MFDDSLFDELPDDHLLATKMICDRFLNYYRVNFTSDRTPSEEERIKVYDDFLNAYGLFKAFVEHHDLEFELPELSNSMDGNINIIADFFSRTNAENTPVALTNMYQKRYAAKLSNIFSYEFSDDDHARVQKIIS